MFENKNILIIAGTGITGGLKSTIDLVRNNTKFND
tara:strand:+ start:743 stop:847 length:105 start_codon:yes stop_codon:yes gene_type:complete